MTSIQEEVDALLPVGGYDQQRARLAGAILTTGAQTSTVQIAVKGLTAAVAQYAQGNDVDLLAAATAVTDAESEQRARSLLLRELQNQKDELGLAAETLTPAMLRPALDLLRHKLSEVVTTVRDLDLRLGNVSDATAALREGRGEDWRQLDEALTTYDAIRTAQRSVYLRSRGVEAHELAPLMTHTGLLADAIQVDPHYIEQRWYAARISPNHWTDEQAWVDWLRAIPQRASLPALMTGEWLPDTNQHQYLRLIATQATPWVPDLDTLYATGAAATTATSETLGNGNTTHLVAARTEYAKLTGTHINIPSGAAS